MKYMLQTKTKRYNATYNMFVDFVACNFQLLE